MEKEEVKFFWLGKGSEPSEPPPELGIGPACYLDLSRGNKFRDRRCPHPASSSEDRSYSNRQKLSEEHLYESSMCVLCPLERKSIFTNP